jgi:hypothetical protein
VTRTEAAIGQRFGRLVVLRISGRDAAGRARFACLCDCGQEANMDAHNVIAGRSTSCGCRNREVAGARLRMHGLTKSPEHRVWTRMRDRCSNAKSATFQRYGGRGIRVCARWDDPATGFEAFLADMGERPSPEHSIDRIENAKGYEPGNCRWATRVEQANNKRSNHLVTFRGETLTVAQWARRVGLSHDTVKQRLRAGWSVERTLTEGPDPRRLTKAKEA